MERMPEKEPLADVRPGSGSMGGGRKRGAAVANRPLVHVGDAAEVAPARQSVSGRPKAGNRSERTKPVISATSPSSRYGGMT
jgi:hypothetical protein